MRAGHLTVMIIFIRYDQSSDLILLIVPVNGQDCKWKSGAKGGVGRSGRGLGAEESSYRPYFETKIKQKDGA